MLIAGVVHLPEWHGAQALAMASPQKLPGTIVYVSTFIRWHDKPAQTKGHSQCHLLLAAQLCLLPLHPFAAPSVSKPQVSHRPMLWWHEAA